MPWAAMLPTAAMAATGMMHFLIVTKRSLAAQVVTEAMAAAVPVQASARAAVLAAAVAAAVNAPALLEMKKHNMAWMEVPAVPVVPLTIWDRSMRFCPLSRWLPLVAQRAQTVLVAIGVSPLRSTLARMYIWHLVAVAAAPAASAVLPLPSAPVVPAAAVAAAVPLVTLPGWSTLEQQMATIMQERKAVKAVPTVIAHRLPRALLLS